MQIYGNVTQIKNVLDSLFEHLSERMDILCSASLSLFCDNEEYLVLFHNTSFDVSVPYSDTISSNEIILIKKTDYDTIKNSSVPPSNLLNSSVQKKPERGIPQTAQKKDKTNTLYTKAKQKISPDTSLHKKSFDTLTVTKPSTSKRISSDTELFIIEDHISDCMGPNRPAAFAIKQLSNNYYLLFYRKSVYDQGIDTSFRRYLSQQPGTLVAYKYFCNLANLRNEFNKHQLHLRHNGKNELSHYQAVEILKTFSVLKYL